MLAEQCKILISRINAALSEPLNNIDQDAYNQSKVIITKFYESHKETTPTAQERDKLIEKESVLEEIDMRYALVVYRVTIWIIEVYDVGDQLEKEYIHKIKQITKANIDIEELESVGFDFE